MLHRCCPIADLQGARRPAKGRFRKTVAQAAPDPVGLYAEPETVASPVAPIRHARRRSAKRLRLVSMLVLGLTLSGLAIADYFGAAVPIVAYAAVSLLVIGLTLIAATRFGRPCGLLPT
ncbi:MAG: hypothetical protein V4583_21915, partial [Pseudomonadota bacterium]